MKQSKSALEVIDLSFLSAEEEAAIRQVLLRDEDLKRLESGRVRKLRQSVPDLTQLKTLSGEWFEELKVKRYGQQTDVTAVVRSSMRWKKTAGMQDAAQDTKPERGTTKHATNPEPRRKVSLPPALRKEQSFEENWVKISLEPNTVKPVDDESNSVGPNQKEVKLHVENTEALKKQDTSSPNTEPPSLNFTDQTSFQIVSQAEPIDVYLERCSSTEFQNQPQTSLVFTSDGVYSDAGDFGNVEVQGSVEFAVMYSPVGELIIMIEQCQDLAIANPRKQRTDPYVKTYLYPDKSRRSKRKTSIKKRTVNPVYVESLRYKVKREELPDKTLNLSVWHNDSRGRNVFLGQVEIRFKTWDWGHEALTWYNLQPKVHCLKLLCGSKNSTGEIHVWLREAKELRRLKPQGVDSFVKCYILPDTRKKSRQKTRIIKKTQDPVYNHAMVYDGFKTGEVSEACCELTVWDHNTLANQFLGGLRLSLGTGQSYGKKVDWMDSMDEEIQIWKRMLANPNSWVEGELPLRSSMTPRK
uniref:Synaptotagmin-like protein 1 n=1 Tax=Cyprinus carpio TaxID=7962 RepID=A0A8C1GFE7_CYPCA